jgi:alpha/beta superfamily hydrolase
LKIPPQTRPFVWGAVGGALLCAILGFSWGGWVTGRTAREEAADSAHDARVAALAPICAQRFRAQANAPDELTKLAAASSWERANVVEKSGAALMPGSTQADDDVARACARLLMSQPSANKT